MSMNEFQEALNRLYGGAVSHAVNSLVNKDRARRDYAVDKNKIQELVDKATPKKPKINHYGNCGDIKIICPNGCGIQLNGLGEDGESKYYTHDYCQKCGQAIDWSKDE